MPFLLYSNGTFGAAKTTRLVEVQEINSDRIEVSSQPSPGKIENPVKESPTLNPNRKRVIISEDIIDESSPYFFKKEARTHETTKKTPCNSEKNNSSAKLKGKDDSVLSYNFLFFIIQKFKVTEIIG